MTNIREKTQVRIRTENSGFTLLEMMVSIGVMLIVSGAAFVAINQSQKVYGSQELQADMHAGLRSAFELLGQEIGQAGSLNLTPTTLAAAVTQNAAAQTVTVASSANIFVNEQLTVDTGATQEVVKVLSLPGTNQINGIFTASHASGVPVAAQGVFPTGMLAPTTAASNTLQIFGDINADNTVTFVEYDCNPGTLSAPGTLTRSLTVVAPGVTTKNPSQILLNTLIANPQVNGTTTPCFTPSMGAGGAVTNGNCNVTGYSSTCVTDMQVMLTVATSEADPQRHIVLSETKSFLNISSRNVFAAYMIATSTSPVANLMQITPPGLPLN